jgi:hypothetical protein
MPKESAWVEGFVSECDELGLPKEAAAELLKTAVQLSMCEDEHFAEAFTAEMEKSGGLPTALLAAPAGILGFLGLQKLVDAIRKNWGRNPEETALLTQMEDALGHPDPGKLVEQMDILRRASHRSRTPIGGEYTDPLLGGPRSDYY